MIIDPDKKVEEAQKNREADYKSEEHPEHFGAEGDEYISRTANRKEVRNTMAEDLKTDKIKEAK